MTKKPLPSGGRKEPTRGQHGGPAPHDGGDKGAAEARKGAKGELRRTVGLLGDRSVQVDKGLLSPGPTLLVWPFRQARGTESRGKNCINTNTNIKTHLTKSYPGNTTTPIATAGGSPDERKGERPRKPRQERSRQTEPGGIPGILTSANQGSTPTTGT